MTRSSSQSRPHSVGRSIPKAEAPDKVTGRAQYVEDLLVPGMLHGRTVRSAIARGRVVKVELDPAFDWKGVTVADHKDIPGENVVALIEDDQPLLVAEEIRHAEEPILLLAHESAERVEQALKAVHIQYEPLDPILTIEDSLAKKALLYSDDNVFKEIHIRRGNLDAELARSDRVITGTYKVGHQEHVYIENNGMLAERTPDGGLLVRGSLQCPYYVHVAIMRAFDLGPDQVRVVQTTTGGGFGGKEEYPSMIGAHAALLAWKSGKPVRIVYDRLEDIAATTKRHPAVMHVRAGVMNDGTLRAFDVDCIMDGGAYVTLSPVVLSRGAIHGAGPYRWPAARIRARAVATNTPPNGAFRGFGAPQTQFAVECHLDRIAAELKIDPLDLRRRNAVKVGDVTPTGQTLRESVGASDCLERTATLARYRAKRAQFTKENAAAEKAEQRPVRRAAHGAPLRRIRKGIGLALAYHGAGFTGSGETRLASVVALDLLPDGRARALAASTEIGQGTNTVFAQMVAEGLGTSPEMVVVQQPDTVEVPNSGPTVASRTVMVVGGLLARAGRSMRETLEQFHGRPMRTDLDFRAVARKYLSEHGALRIEEKYAKPDWIQWDDDRYVGDAYPVFSYGALTAEVEVDLDTGETKVTNVVTAQDIGRAIHPVLAAGQIEGGTLQGLGWALTEEVRWKDGRVWNHQLTNYIIPTSADAPPMHVAIVEHPFSGGPFGAKGVGELPMDVPAPAVIAAIAHATGKRLDEIPATPERVLRALANGIGGHAAPAKPAGRRAKATR